MTPDASPPPEAGAEAGAEADAEADERAAARARLFAFLDELGIATTTVEHPPVFTVEEARRLRGRIPGGHCKSLFLKDRKGGLWLAVVDESRRVDLAALARRLGAPRFSFGKPELLRAALGVAPGSVTPFALVRDRAERRVSVVLDAAMLARERLNYHPLDNRATTTISAAGLGAFVAACGHTPYIVDFDALAAGGRTDGADDRR